MPRVHPVAILAFDRISAFHLAAPCVVFGEACPLPERFPVQVCAWEVGPLRTTSGFTLSVEHGLEALARAEVVIVPSWRDPAERAPEAVLDALRAAHARGAQVVGLCLGAYLLAQAGLLDGRGATTHWAYAADFARRHPQVRLNADVLYLADGALLTSAGTAAALDCCLQLLRERLGAEDANRAARRLVIAPHRAGGQAQFIERPLPSTRDDARLAGLLDEVRAQLDAPHSLDALAARALMSRRTFTRHFRQLTGQSFQAWLLGERLAFSQRLLEVSALPIERIAALAGFGSPEAFRLHFRRSFAVSPSAWRQAFTGG